MTDQLRLFHEAEARDRALANLEEHREDHISTARTIALALHLMYGRVTSTEVLEEMRRICPELLEGVDPRFMGCVFRRGWRRIGYESSGSHRRPVSIWVRK